MEVKSEFIECTKKLPFKEQINYPVRSNFIQVVVVVGGDHGDSASTSVDLLETK
jgi:hypothetical protein